MKFKKIMLIVIIIFIILMAIYFLLWLLSMKTYHVEYGISFNQNYAASLNLDWKQAYIEMLEDLKPKYIRIAAMWSEIEKEEGNFNFIDVDWMMAEAKEKSVKVTLVVGQKAPRWPECHVPEWVKGLEKPAARQRLFDYVQAVVERYKNHEALEVWQVENEPFIRFRFGECQGYDEEATWEEIELVRSLDPNHKILVTDSGELSTWRRASQAGDLFGITVYRIVHNPQGRVFTYSWLPPAFYRWKAKFWGRNMNEVFISELQVEPWFTDGGALNTPLEEQEKTMDPKRLQKHLDYASLIGVPRAYLWGVEWWYWMKERQGKGEYWDIIKSQLVK